MQLYSSDPAPGSLSAACRQQRNAVASHAAMRGQYRRAARCRKTVDLLLCLPGLQVLVLVGQRDLRRVGELLLVLVDCALVNDHFGRLERGRLDEG